MAHRVAYELINGPIPEGLMVRHKCDNPPCCNPSHLTTGTAKDNAQDAVSRHRASTGVRNGRAKLTEADVAAIVANPEKLKGFELARKFAVSDATISMIRSQQRWAAR